MASFPWEGKHRREYNSKTARALGTVCQAEAPFVLYVSLGDVDIYANTEGFQDSVPWLPHLCPLSVPVGWGGGIFGKPLKRAIWNTAALHAVLTICLRFSSVLDGACVACCPFLSTTTCNVFTVLGPVLQHIVSMPKRGGWKFVHFYVLNSNMQEFGLNKTIY